MAMFIHINSSAPACAILKLDMVPHKFSSLFWDVEQKKLHPERHRQFIIERTLEKGREQEIRWLFRKYKEDTITQALKGSSNITRKTAWLWSKILNIPARNITCLKKPYQQRPFNF